MQNYSMYKIFYPLIKAGALLFFYDATGVLEKLKKMHLLVDDITTIYREFHVFDVIPQIF